jgi:hypothetical protein
MADFTAGFVSIYGTSAEKANGCTPTAGTRIVSCSIDHQASIFGPLNLFLAHYLWFCTARLKYAHHNHCYMFAACIDSIFSHLHQLLRFAAIPTGMPMTIYASLELPVCDSISTRPVL